MFNQASRNSGPDLVCGNVLIYNRSGADHRSPANCHSRQDHGSRPNPQVIAKIDRMLLATLIGDRNRRINAVLVVGDEQIGSNQHVVTNAVGLGDVELGPAADKSVLSDLNGCTAMDEFQPNKTLDGRVI